MRRIVILAVTTVLLAGCSSGSDSHDASGSAGDGSATPTTSAAPAPPAGPECADIWKAGATLPDGYDQCITDGVAGAQDVISCDDGSKLITFRDSMYAVTGHQIVKPDIAPLQDTEEYGATFSACTGE